MISAIAFLKKVRRLYIEETLRNKQYSKFKEQMAGIAAAAGPNMPLSEYPCLSDDTGVTPIEPHYTYHPAWAARVLAETKPAKHIDISSIMYFSNIVSAFIPVEFYDYRPANIHLSNYQSGRADLTDLHFESGSIKSLSCMHTVEHIGLGRYGDALDYYGDIKAMKELTRVLAVNGNLLFVVPIGNERIEFNAHRVYNYQTIIKNFDGLTLKEFTLIPDDFENIGYIKNPSTEIIKAQRWGCGCFWFTKK